VVSVPEAARLLGISKDLAYDLARRGELPGAFQLGRRRRVSLIRLRAVVHGPEDGAAEDSAISFCTSATSGAVAVERAGRGAVARSAGLAAIRPHLTARRRDAWRIEWCWWMDEPETLFLERTVEGVELTGAQPVQAHVPQSRLDRFVYQATVLVDRVSGPVGRYVVEPTVEQVAHVACARGTDLLLLNLGHQPRQRTLCLSLGPPEISRDPTGLAVFAAREDPQPPVAPRPPRACSPAPALLPGTVGHPVVVQIVVQKLLRGSDISEKALREGLRGEGSNLQASGSKVRRSSN
jgi:excisionase family DNA binding protein